MLSINTNLSSIIAQRSMKQSSLSLDIAVERMSTGYKINHSKDNAANYSIATNMDTKIGALQVAEDNALQGLEMISTTSENLTLIEDKLSRMRALAVQSLNGTYGEKSLNAINSEANALLNEVVRLNESASYNGIKLFNTGKKEVTNAGKELKLNEQGFLQDVVKVDTTSMTKLSSVDPNATLSVGEYSISTVDELVQLKEMSDAGFLEKGSTFVLARDIDMSGITDWSGIGAINAFGGIFNGNGFTISNLTGSQGLFKSIQKNTSSGSNSRIENVRLENITVSAGWDSGALCGFVRNADVFNCSIVNASITFYNGARQGGVVGNIEGGNVKYCYFNGNITGNEILGGIVGWGGADSCFAEGTIEGNNTVGGISGIYGSINSKMIGTVIGKNAVGGISGSRQVKNSYFSGNVIGESKVGGIVGETSQYSNGPQDCIMEGSVSGITDVGIIVGNVYSGKTVNNCYYYGKNTPDLEVVGTMDTAIISNILDITIPCDYTLHIGSSGDDKTSTISCTTYIDFSGLNNVISSGINSSDSISKIEDIIKIVELKQTELGTVQNRLESVLEEISTQYENLVSSRSTLQDADIAEVSSEYIRQQILQQASATLLATANQSPSIALQLI